MKKAMKKIAVVCIALMMVALAGCSLGGVSQEEYDKVVSERDELNIHQSESAASTTQNNLLEVLSSNITFDDGSTLTFVISDNNGILEGIAAFLFTGDDVKLEGERIATVAAIYGAVGVEKHSIIAANKNPIILRVSSIFFNNGDLDGESSISPAHKQAIIGADISTQSSIITDKIISINTSNEKGKKIIEQMKH